MFQHERQLTDNRFKNNLKKRKSEETHQDTNHSSAQKLLPIKIRIRESNTIVSDEFFIDQNDNDDDVDLNNPLLLAGSLVQDLNLPDSMTNSIAISISEQTFGLIVPDDVINTNFEGIARFYRDILGAPVLQSDPSCCVVSVGPYQTISFVPHPDGVSTIISHDDLRDESALDDDDCSKPYFPSNYGPHISIYVADIRSTYKRAQAFGVTYVNPRFKRRAYNEEEVVDDCMFRCINIVDPENRGDGVILKLEHEIRSVVKRDGSLYKSCPFRDIPRICII